MVLLCSRSTGHGKNEHCPAYKCLHIMNFYSTYFFFRKDCEAVINLCASEDGTALVVNRYDDRHNHEISQVGSGVCRHVDSLHSVQIFLV